MRRDDIMSKGERRHAVTVPLPLLAAHIVCDGATGGDLLFDLKELREEWP